MRRIALALVILLAMAGVLWVSYSRVVTAQWRPALNARQVATRVLAEYLAKAYPQARALVVGNPFTLRSGQGPEVYAFEKAGVRGLEEGFNKPDAIEVVFPDLKPEFLAQPTTVYVDPKTTTPLSYLVSEDAFDRLIQTHPNFELVVTFIGLPVNIAQSRSWQDVVKPHFALLLPDWRVVGGVDAVREAVKSGKIAAAVVRRPGGIGDETPIQRQEYQSEFTRRFLLVTRENVDELMRTFPRAF
jgi:hypothetical protein